MAKEITGISIFDKIAHVLLRSHVYLLVHVLENIKHASSDIKKEK